SYNITDNNGCVATTTITITEPTAVVATSSATAILCNGGTSTVMVVATGGTSPYTGTGTFTVNAGGPYSYNITDNNGCVSTTTITVTEPTAISVSATSVDVSCFGGTDGAIDLTVSGGTSPYTFDWNSGAFTTEDLTGIPAGSYVGVLTDANGCTDGGTFVINEPFAIVATVTSATDPSTCSGTDGAIDITIAGGTPGYTFLWSNAATSEDITSLSSGAYSCTITDANGCTQSANATLNDPNAPTLTLALPMDTVCGSFPGLINLSGESPAGGTFSGPGVSGNTFDPFTVGMGTYFINYTYTDINGCTGSTSDSIYVDICIGIAAQQVAAPFAVYPNPNNGQFTFVQNAATSVDVLIYNALGQLVNSFTANSGVQQQLNLEISGMYTITVVNADGNHSSQRVIVNR
ncbi:MAG: T9SS type A sorting domain-containing protein, partial [Bacteroidia bacterium]